MACPHCQATAIKQYGVGTEKVESEVHRLLPGARVARLDRDTAPHSGKALTVFESFAAGDLDLLVGTQMIAKGHHFPRVTLVGVVAADLSLFFPEYHAGERTFQLLSQVAGRAGRGQAAGQVLVQTCQPEHYVFQMVQTQDFVGFLRTGDREPAHPGLSALHPAGPGAGERPCGGNRGPGARRLATALKRTIKSARAPARVQVLGPAPAGLSRLKGRYRWQLLLKSYGRPAWLKPSSICAASGTRPPRPAWTSPWTSTRPICFRPRSGLAARPAGSPFPGSNVSSRRFSPQDFNSLERP